MYASRLPRQIGSYDLDVKNAEVEVDIELEEALLHRTLYWARAAEQGEVSAEAQVQLGLYKTAYFENIAGVRRRVRQAMNTWWQGLAVSLGVAPIAASVVGRPSEPIFNGITIS